jgi:hypothetical protein
MITITKVEINIDRTKFNIYCNVSDSSTISNIYVDLLSNKNNILSTTNANHDFNFVESDFVKTTIDESNFYLTIPASKLNETKINKLFIFGIKLDTASIVSCLVTDLFELYPLKLSIVRDINTSGAFPIVYSRYAKLILKENLFISAKVNNDINIALNLYQELLNI